MKEGARKPTGGAMPGAGRKPDKDPTQAVEFRLTETQRKTAKALGGSPWLQGLLNLEIQRQAKTPPP
jgi:hypothetical protein